MELNHQAVAPVHVYLDSQDFSRFSEQKDDEVRQELLQLKGAGVARFVFSDIHIFECFPVAPAYQKEGLERIRTIAELCGRHNLPSSIDLIEYELNVMLATVSPRPNIKVPVDWFPEFDFPKPGKDAYRKSVKELDGVPLNRNARRALVKKLSSGKTPFSPTEAERATDEMMECYPFFSSGRHKILAYFRGEGSWAQVRDCVKEGLRDLPEFSEWLVSHWEFGGKFISGLRSGGESLFNNINKLKDNIAKNVDDALLIMPKVEVEKIVKVVAKEVWPQFFSGVPQRLVHSYLDIQNPPENLPFGPELTPSNWLMWRFIGEVMLKSATVDKARKPRRSDFADAMHVFFAPRVDVFRGDQFSCGVLERLMANSSTHVVASLQDLPGVIREVHRTRLMG